MRKSLLFLTLFSFVLFFFAGCETGGEMKEVTITLVNDDSQDTHLWVGSGSCSPDNKVAPNGSRTETKNLYFSYSLMAAFAGGGELQTSSIEIGAGRNSATLKTEMKEIDPAELNRTFHWKGVDIGFQ